MIDKIGGKIIDLSVDIEEGMSIYPGDPLPKFKKVLSKEKNKYNVNRIVLGTHSGTHVDAPYHWFNSGNTLDKFHLKDFIFRAVVIDMSHKKANERIKLQELINYKTKIKKGYLVLIHTGWDKHWNSPEYENHPFIDGEVANWLLNQGVAAIGIDTLNIDQTKGNKSWAAHEAFMSNNKLIIEVIANLNKLVGKTPLVFVCPLKLIGTDGSPARVFAIDQGDLND